MDHETLLKHAGFLRALTRSLVHDDGAAEDVLQDTWMKALTHGPRSERTARPWLATVAVNFARKQRRARSRRARHERAAAVARVHPAPEDLAEREALIRHVVNAVFDLEEPYRSAVLSRYYEGLRPREIALRTGANEATVRTHLRRGLVRLRERLDRDHGGDRNRWVSAGLALIGSQLATHSPPPTLVAAPLKFLVAASIVLGAGLGGWALLGGERDANPGGGPDRERQRLERAMREAARLPKGAPPVTVGPTPGQLAPPFSLEALLGGPAHTGLDWKALEGKTVVLAFWSTWCDESPSTLARLGTLTAAFRNRPVRCLAITSDDEPTARDYLRRFPTEAWVGVDSDQSMFRAFGILMLPTVVIVDGRTRIRAIMSLKKLTVNAVASCLDEKDR